MRRRAMRWVWGGGEGRGEERKGKISPHHQKITRSQEEGKDGRKWNRAGGKENYVYAEEERKRETRLKKEPAYLPYLP